MKPACPRLFEAEAHRDGRLSGAEVTRFQAHLGVCRVCAREVQALEALAEDLRSTTQASRADELHVRRERTRLLAAFDAALVPAARSHHARPWRAFAVAVAGLAAMAFAFALWPSRPHTPVEVAAELAVVRAHGGAQWSRSVERDVEKVALQSGTLSIHVDRAGSQRRLLVILPDGELEDIGTTFSVSASAGQTTRVEVQDGSVVLRLHGSPSLVLAAGKSWTPPPKATAAASGLPEPPARSAASAATIPSSRATGPRSARTLEPDAASEFRAGLSALNAGDNRRAAALFSEFLARRARDSRAEDAAYLRVLALQRAGDTGATKAAAQEFLNRFPRGFRHAEVERLSR